MINLTLEFLSQENAEEIFEFEKENLDFFEAFVPSRGYRIGQKHGGKGYATAAVKLAVNEAFECHRIEQLEAGTSPSNRGSQIVLIKNGFEFVRREGQAVKVGDRLEDSIWFVKKKAVD